jgi:hypothetical protein
MVYSLVETGAGAVSFRISDRLGKNSCLICP